MKSAEPVLTDDGSRTYLHPVHGASYRSTRGAATESRWVFLQGSRILERKGSWKVLELGFGTGLNFHLTSEAAAQASVDLTYVALEPDPMSADCWLVDDVWRSLKWGVLQQQGPIALTVHRQRWQDRSLESERYDAVYFDPFGPAVAPDCWTTDCFLWAKSALAEDGVLATYGASSAARQAMREAGLVVGILPGAPGKREMTVAGLSPEAISYAKLWKRSGL